MVKSADIYVLAGILVQREPWSYRSLAERLRVPHPVVQRALARAKAADLYSPARREVHRRSLRGVRDPCAALRCAGAAGTPWRPGCRRPGRRSRWPLRSALPARSRPPCGLSLRGRVRGQAIEPLHPAAPEAVEDWPEFGELLAYLDSLRAGDARVRRVAGDLLSGRLRSPGLVADQ